jgi:hypothetical protein
MKYGHYGWETDVNAELPSFSRTTFTSCIFDRAESRFENLLRDFMHFMEKLILLLVSQS